MENKRNRTAATKARPSEQRVVKRTQKIETFCFNLDDIQRIEVKAIPATTATVQRVYCGGGTKTAVVIQAKLDARPSLR
jgi:hypothetical protein